MHFGRLSQKLVILGNITEYTMSKDKSVGSTRLHHWIALVLGYQCHYWNIFSIALAVIWLCCCIFSFSCFFNCKISLFFGSISNAWKKHIKKLYLYRPAPLVGHFTTIVCSGLPLTDMNESISYKCLDRGTIYSQHL